MQFVRLCNYLLPCCLVVSFVGCNSSEPGKGTVQRETMWSTRDTEKVGGLDQAVITQVELEQEGGFFAVWSDKAQGLSIDGYGANDEYRYRGGHGDIDGSKLDFAIKNANLQQVIIDQQTFDVSAGELFLVKTGGEKPVVMQLKLEEGNTRKMPGSRQGLMLMTEKRPEIAEFFKSGP